MHAEEIVSFAGDELTDPRVHASRRPGAPRCPGVQAPGCAGARV